MNVPEVTPGTMRITAQIPPPVRPIRKDEIELDERGLYIESWLPERRSRRKPLLFVHGELAGSWLWERFLAYFAGRGWEGHALNLRNHYWSQTADPTTLSFESYTDDVAAAIDRLGEGVVVIGHAMGGLLGLKAAGDRPIGGMVLLSPELPDELRRVVEGAVPPQKFGAIGRPGGFGPGHVDKGDRLAKFDIPRVPGQHRADLWFSLGDDQGG